ncbi:MAG: DUF4404 family protein [Gammaproteobacteria bacterium]|nr:DUF4404 family protein [Gammaproteobacteria bacterium]
MTSQELNELLGRVHDALAQDCPLDAESSRLLAVVQEDIVRVTAAQPVIAAGHVPALERIAVHFESDHPSVAAAARALIDALGKAGI